MVAREYGLLEDDFRRRPKARGDVLALRRRCIEIQELRGDVTSADPSTETAAGEIGEKEERRKRGGQNLKMTLPPSGYIPARKYIVEASQFFRLLFFFWGGEGLLISDTSVILSPVIIG